MSPGTGTGGKAVKPHPAGKRVYCSRRGLKRELVSRKSRAGGRCVGRAQDSGREL